LNIFINSTFIFLSFFLFKSSLNLKKGEVIETKVTFSLFNAGKASMIVDNKIYNINNRACYKVDVFGRTTGIFDFFARVRDNWGVYIDTVDYNPQKFYKYLQEGKYRKNEILRFDDTLVDSVEVIVLDKVTKQPSEIKYLHLENDFKDIMRGYFMNYWISSVFYLRNLDYSNIPIDTLIEIPSLKDKGKYNYKMKFLGKIKISSNNKDKVNALAFSPEIPKNKLFSGDNPVTFWLSDDDKKIPLRLTASMYFGSFDVKTINFDSIISDSLKENIYNKYR